MLSLVIIQNTFILCSNGMWSVLFSLSYPFSPCCIPTHYPFFFVHFWDLLGAHVIMHQVHTCSLVGTNLHAHCRIKLYEKYKWQRISCQRDLDYLNLDPLLCVIRLERKLYVRVYESMYCIEHLLVIQKYRTHLMR